MIDHLRIRNFQSWQDMDDVRLDKLTGLFGANSSGNTSLLLALPREQTERELKPRYAPAIILCGLLYATH